MNNEDNIIEARGLNRNSNDIILPQGSLVAADECIVVKDNIISRRRGFKLCNTDVPAATPEQLFVSGGVLYVHTNNKLYYKNNACTYILVQGLSPTFSFPTGVWGNSTDLYITDTSNSTIRKFNFATLTASTFAGTAGITGGTDGVGSAARFGAPVGIWGNATDLYVVDSTRMTIRAINIATATVTTFAGTDTLIGSADGVGAIARFNFPNGIWGDATNLYICDRNNSTIRAAVIATANVTTFAGTAGMAGHVDGIGAAARFFGPRMIWGNATDLYITDGTDNTIRAAVIATANVTTFAGTSGPGGSTDGVGAIARFNLPYGIWGDATNLYICDYSNDTVRKAVIATASVTTFAGTAGSGGSADGVGSAARFNGTAGIWGNATDLYVVDQINNTIRKIVISSVNVSTYVGQPGVAGAADGTIISVQGPT